MTTLGACAKGPAPIAEWSNVLSLTQYVLSIMPAILHYHRIIFTSPERVQRLCPDSQVVLWVATNSMRVGIHRPPYTKTTLRAYAKGSAPIAWWSNELPQTQYVLALTAYEYDARRMCNGPAPIVEWSNELPLTQQILPLAPAAHNDDARCVCKGACPNSRVVWCVATDPIRAVNHACNSALSSNYICAQSECKGSAPIAEWSNELPLTQQILPLAPAAHNDDARRVCKGVCPNSRVV